MFKQLVEKYHKKIIGALAATLLGTGYIATGNPKINDALASVGLSTVQKCRCGCGCSKCECGK